MKKTIIYIVSTFFISLVPIAVLLFGYYINLRKISYDFQRTFIKPVKNIEIKNIKYNSYYFAGQSGNNIFLGNLTANRHILKVSTSLKDTQSVTIYVKGEDFRKRGYYKAFVDSLDFYLFNGFERSVLFGQVNNWTANVDEIFTPFFTQSVPLSHNSIVFRIVSAKTGNNSLRKESLNGERIDNDRVLEKQVDGVFCTDGILEFNKYLNQFIYMYYYRNQILVLDTNLNLVRKIKTIDPIDTAQFEIYKIKSNDNSTFSTTHLLVNTKCSAWNKFLFVQSKLMGKNEDEGLFKTSSVIDVYDITKAVYLYSFYLPGLNFGSIRQFKVLNDGIVTLSGNFIVKYSLKLPLNVF